MDYIIRKANLEDRAAIERLIAESARGLSRDKYSNPQIEAAIAMVFGVDTDLILDGTYLVVEADGAIVGCGGWSKRKTLFGGDRFAVRDSSRLDPQTEAARIRAFFVHPDYARKGIARAILSECESAAREHGFRSLELMATLPGIKFYEAHDYKGKELVEYEIAEGIRMEFLPMRKEFN
ncbi:MAG TPA: GNAT family N-acetyltransferase [Pyrinomonadaceae bacterium]|jgi:GNAT superfamily N-acetyltransferase